MTWTTTDATGVDIDRVHAFANDQDHGRAASATAIAVLLALNRYGRTGMSANDLADLGGRRLERLASIGRRRIRQALPGT